jgi:hypothetical protein
MNVGSLDAGRTERVLGELVSGTYFQVLGVGAAAGRLIDSSDDKTRGDGLVAVLSYDYWRNRFAGNPNVIGQRLHINNQPFTIIGVSQQGFDGLDIGAVPSVRVPLMMKAQMTPNWDDVDNRRSRWVNVFARLKPGVSREQALAIVQTFFQRPAAAGSGNGGVFRTTSYTREQFLKGQVDLLPAAQGRSPIRQQLADPLRLLFYIVGGVLLIACANVASLLIARASSPPEGNRVRLALGASRGRIVGQLLVESVMLAAAGGVLGLAIASVDDALSDRLPAGNRHAACDFRIARSPRSRVQPAAVAGNGIVFGLVPALRSTKPNLAPTLKDQVGCGGRQAAAFACGRRWSWRR